MTRDRHETYQNMEGDGHPSCKECGGRGVITKPIGKDKVPSVFACKCVMLRNIVFNVEKCWPGLSKAKKVKQSPLQGREGESLWITASQETFRAHMRYISFRKGPHWKFRGCSDKDLVNAWLAVAKAEGRNILDNEVAESTIQYMTLEDLVEPPDLLVILLGVKRSSNKSMPDLVVEAINSRAFCNKPTWVVDSPSNPLRPGHLCYSAEVHEILSSYRHLKIGGAAKPNRASTPTSRPRPSSPRIEREARPHHEGSGSDELLNGTKKKKKRWNS